MTGQGLDEDDIRKRDEEANIYRVHQTNAAEKQRWKNAVLLKSCASGSVKKALSLVLSGDVCFCQEATEPAQWKTATFRPSQSMEHPIAISVCP